MARGPSSFSSDLHNLFDSHCSGPMLAAREITDVRIIRTSPQYTYSLKKGVIVWKCRCGVIFALLLHHARSDAVE